MEYQCYPYVIIIMQDKYGKLLKIEVDQYE
jgi:hypothetical protein